MIIDEGHIIKNVLDNTTGVERIVKKTYIEDQLVFNSPLGSLEDRSTYMNDNTQNVIDRGEKLLLTPTAWSVGAIHSALPKDGSGDFAFSRNSSATYIEGGIIKTALPNVPRIQGGKILIEGQATNLVKISNVETQEFYVQHVDYEPYEWANGLQHSLYFLSAQECRYWAGVVQANTQYTISTFIRKDDMTMPVHGVDFYFRIGDFYPTLESIKMEHVIEAIWRVSGTGVSTTTSLNRSGIQTASALNNVRFRASGIQIEEGDKATSYIPTNGTAVTRLADIATVTPPLGITQIIETINGVEQPPITVIPPTYQLPEGEIDNVKMI